MTSTVKVTAHCTDDKQVVVTQTYPGSSQIKQDVVLQNGESWDGVVYDSWVVTVTEVQK